MMAALQKTPAPLATQHLRKRNVSRCKGSWQDIAGDWPSVITSPASKRLRTSQKYLKFLGFALLEYEPRGVAEDSANTSRVLGVDKGRSVDLVGAHPFNREGLIGFFDMHRQGVSLLSHRDGKMVDRVQQPGITRFGREQQ